MSRKGARSRPGSEISVSGGDGLAGDGGGQAGGRVSALIDDKNRHRRRSRSDPDSEEHGGTEGEVADMQMHFGA